MKLRWTEAFTAHSFDVDFQRRTSAETVCRWFLEAAWTHAEHLGFGYSHLASSGKLWVLSRLVVEIDSYPAWGDSVFVATWPRAEKSVFAMREFQMFNANEVLTARGTSAWLVLDANTRRPVRSDKLLASVPDMLQERATESSPEKIPPLPEPDNRTTFQVLYSDIDVNSHVNSCTYVRWMLNAYPLGFHATHRLRKLEINYLDETRESETLSLACATDSVPHYHAVTKSTGGDVCRALLYWDVLAR